METNCEKIDELINYVLMLDSEIVADIIYEKHKDEIYRDLNIKTKGDYVSILGDTEAWSSHELENAWNCTYGYLETYFKFFSLTDIMKFEKQLMCKKTVQA